jgi:hypothetical protein
VIAAQESSPADVAVAADAEEEDLPSFSLFDDLPEPTPVASNAMWACEVCTLMNDPHSTECVVCATPRVTDSGASGGGGAGGGAASASAGWWCVACTFINPLSTTR